MNTFIKSFSVLVLLLMITACTKNFEKINTNPRIVTEDIADPALIFTAVQKSSMFGLRGSDGILEAYSGYIGNNALGSVFSNQPWDEPFTTFYRDYLININETIRLSKDDSRLADLNSFARIWRAWLFARLTDLYGDIPYFEAAKSVDEAVLSPKYNTQQEIYIDLLNELKASVSVLKASDASRRNIGNADIMYGGNVDNWIRLGNSIRLRLSMRVSYVDPQLASENVNEVINDELITENDQNAGITTGGSSAPAENRNPYYNGIAGGAKEFRWASFTMAEAINKLNDPRGSKFLNLSILHDYFGILMNLSQEEKNVDVGRPDNSESPLSDFVWRSDARVTLMNASETFFLRAEAALRGITSEDAQLLYATGIGKSMDNFGVSDPSKMDYLAGSTGMLSGTADEKLEMIIVQKWLGNYCEFEEGYAEFRRTGYPRIWTGSAPGATNGEIPRRIEYPLSEYTANGTNVGEAVSRLSNGDLYTSKVWWDTNPDVPKHHPKQGIYPPF